MCTTIAVLTLQPSAIRKLSFMYIYYKYSDTAAQCYNRDTCIYTIDILTLQPSAIEIHVYIL